eukprot:sb/3464369/
MEVWKVLTVSPQPHLDRLWNIVPSHLQISKSTPPLSPENLPNLPPSPNIPLERELSRKSHLVDLRRELALKVRSNVTSLGSGGEVRSNVTSLGGSSGSGSTPLSSSGAGSSKLDTTPSPEDELSPDTLLEAGSVLMAAQPLQYFATVRRYDLDVPFENRQNGFWVQIQKIRTPEEEIQLLEAMFREDLTEEEKGYYKQAYELLILSDPDLMDGVTWLSPTEHMMNSRRRQASTADHLRHRSGCARTEGYYKMTKQEKIALRNGHNKSLLTAENGTGTTTTAPKEVPVAPVKKVDGKHSARSTRALQRRQATHYLDVPDLQFQQLSTRRKLVQFQRSDIHDWGLFAQEPIIADEMVIEYVGQVVREIIANIREVKYEKMGIGSSYLFRIDQSSYIVDATHRGSISRFINHNCDPNCYARVISVGTKKKIVIYSKRDIAQGEEITYDYKFAIEEEANKIRCLCQSALCRGYLN